jgi:hypothetical protein
MSFSLHLILDLSLDYSTSQLLIHYCSKFQHLETSLSACYLGNQILLVFGFAKFLSEE